MGRTLIHSGGNSQWQVTFSKLKALLRKAAERSVDGLWNSIGRLLKLVTPNECQNYFKAAGYDAT